MSNEAQTPTLLSNADSFRLELGQLHEAQGREILIVQQAKGNPDTAPFLAHTFGIVGVSDYRPNGKPQSSLDPVLSADSLKKTYDPNLIMEFNSTFSIKKDDSDKPAKRLRMR